MDFHILTRKELQSLCKLNKIPANITNVAMADALQSLDIVEGIEKFLKVSESETVDLNESKENVEVSSPKAPTTRCRTTTRQKVQPTETKTTRRGTSKKLAGGVEESKNEVLETPALSSTKRRALDTSSCRNVNSQLNDCEIEAKEDHKSPAAVVTKSRRKVVKTSTTVKESTVQKAYGTRRSTRQTEKKSGEPKVKKESGKAVKINSMLDEVIVLTDDEVLPVEIPENTVIAGNLNAEVDEICDAFEELDVVVNLSEEIEDSGEVDDLRAESDEISNLHEEGDSKEEQNDEKPEIDGLSNPCENGDLDGGKLESEIMVSEAHPDSILDDIIEPQSGVAVGDHTEADTIADNTENVCGQAGNDMILDNTVESVNVNDCSPDDESSNDIKEHPDIILDDDTENTESGVAVAEYTEEDTNAEDLNGSVCNNLVLDNTVNSVNEDDFSPVDDSLSPIIEVVEDIFKEKADEEKQFSPSPTTLFDLIGHTTHLTPIRKSLSKNDAVKTPSLSSSRRRSPATASSWKINSQLNDQKSECKVSSPVTAVTSNWRKGATPSTTMTEKKSSELKARKESGKAVKIDTMLDEENAKSEEVLPVEVSVPENTTIDAGNPDAEVDKICKTFENLDVLVEETADITVETVVDMEAVHERSEEKEENYKFEISNDFEETLKLDMEDSDGILNPSESFDLVEKIEQQNDNADMETGENDETIEVEDLKPEVVVTENASILVDDVLGGPTPMKKFSSSIVTDDKENSAIVFVKKSNKEKDNDVIRSLQYISLRQLRKQVKALTLNSKNVNRQDEAIKEGGTARPALQALSENRLVVGETKN